jgi:hypothetical protein
MNEEQKEIGDIKLKKNEELNFFEEGKTISDLIATYQILLDLGYRHIAFNHSSIAYQEMFKDKGVLDDEKDILNRQMFGRLEFIRQLVQTNTIT